MRDLLGHRVASRRPFRTFWVVWCPTGMKPPSYRHETPEHAQREAERLAIANPELQFFVLRSESCSQAPRVVTTRSEAADADIPF
jgi:hypothetical protein